MLALGACATLGAARADVITLWATSVPETSSPASTTPWTNEGYAASAPTCNNCNTTTPPVNAQTYNFVCMRVTTEPLQ